MAKIKKHRKKIVILIGAFLLIYLGFTIFFMNHFFFRTTINGQSFSASSLTTAQNYFEEKVHDYQLTIIRREGERETISGTDITLAFTNHGEIHRILDEQNPFLWPQGLFSPEEFTTPIGVSYDEGALLGQIEQLNAVTTEQLPPISAKPVLHEGEFIIEPETLGNTVNTEKLTTVISMAISSFQSEVNLDEQGVYVAPRFTATSPEVIGAKDTLNRYISASITYQMGTDVVVDRALISNWVQADEDMNVTIDENKVKEWLAAFGKKHDTIGTTRTFTTPTGRNVQVSGGYYGWRVNQEEELKDLLENIRQGETVSREPNYTWRAAVHGPQDWGTTFVQVDLTTQHMWYIVNGDVVFETPVVTGLPRDNRETPPGVFIIQELLRDTVLVGVDDPETGEPIYETPVAYWMRITWSGIGFHDATWQPTFGGTRYREHGSHGCINMPLEKARELFGMLDTHIPVVVHY